VRPSAARHGLFLLAWACTAHAAFGQKPDRPKVIYEPIVLSGQPAPAPAGGAFSEFPYHSVINDANQIAFRANTSGASSPDGLYLSDGDAIHHVAHVGQPAPGFATGVTIQSFDINQHRANDQGQVVFESTLVGPGMLGTGDDDSNAFANWFWSAGVLQPIAQYQAPAPGTTARFRTFGRTTIDDLGNVAFAGDLTGDGVTSQNDSAFWYGPPNDLRVLAREGAAAPGGVSFGELSGFDYPVLARNGRVAFTSDLAGGGRGLFAGTGDALQLVAKSGDAIPGAGVNYGDIRGHGTPPRPNNRGDVVFVSHLSDGGRALLAGAPDDIEIVARTGSPAPDLAGRNFDFFFDYGINDRGQVAFHAETRDGAAETGFAIYRTNPAGAVELIAADGQPAPGAEDGVNFRYFHNPVINRDGQVAFFAALTGDGARGPNDYGLFATGHNGELRLVARYGDAFEVAPGDSRTIEALSHAGVHGSHIVTFNEDSALSMLIKFGDGSEGIFTATVLPEPSSLGLAILAMIAGARRRSRLKCRQPLVGWDDLTLARY
jgi:hypothetical protein